MLASIRNLREISRQCLSGEALDEDLADWLGQSIAGYLERRHRTLEEAFDLIFAQGGIPWWREEANRRRDAALRQLAERCYGHLTPSRQAREIATAALRYAASAWCRDREGEAMPRHYQETSKEWLWRAFRSGAAMPLGERQLRNILAR